MCCITLVAQETTMATTQLMRAASCENCWTWPKDSPTVSRPPRMNWVVVTDKNQNRYMQMQWKPSAGNR